jgi:uncharacterized protein (DUF2062 family)
MTTDFRRRPMLFRPKNIREQFRSIWISHSSPRKLALALAVGVFLGASPLWGLHTLLAIAASVVLNLNKPAALFGTLISNPLLAPFLIFASLETGSWFLYGRTAYLSLAEVQHHIRSPIWHDILNEYLLPYCVGSVIVGLVLAFITFWVALWLARSYRAAQ